MIVAPVTLREPSAERVIDKAKDPARWQEQRRKGMKNFFYHHTFPTATVATATVSDGDPPSFNVEWSGQVSTAMLPEYLAWRQTFVADFEKRTGKRTLVITPLL